MKYLLGKWRDQGAGFREARGFRLSSHVTEVLWAWQLLFEHPFDGEKSFGRALHTRMALPGKFAQFKLQCLLACLFHDIGKSGGEFQEMLWRMELEHQRTKTSPLPQNRYVQGYRHEFLSGLLLYQVPELRAYIEGMVGAGLPFFEVLAGAAGHHLKSTFSRGVREEVLEDPTWTPKAVSLSGWCSFAGKLSTSPALQRHGVTPHPMLADLPASTSWLSSPKHLDAAWKDLRTASGVVLGEDLETKTSAAIKWVVILADTFGSMDSLQTEQGSETRERIRKTFLRIGDPVADNYLSRASKKLGGAAPQLNALQEASGKVQGSLIITASTGIGKTIAGLSWASSKPQRRLIFAAHTTDAATVLHQDYALTGDILKHSRAWMDLKQIPTPESSATATAEEAEELSISLRSVQDGEAPLSFCTADQVLGLIAYYRKSIMWLPYLLTSQIVFDEVHSYDSTMRGWYERFLGYFPLIRTCHLSATLPLAMTKKIQALTGAHHDPTIYDSAPATIALRYRIEVLTRPPTKMPDRCLWFTNVVDRCQRKAQRHKAVAYHSRFRFGDRRASRKSLVEGFRSKEPVRVVATQVAEMSLDISASEMVSEICPPAAVIQRMGRLNREANPSKVCTAYFYRHDSEGSPSGKPHHGLPYSTLKNWEAEYDLWEDWLRGLAGRDLSQKDLEDAFQAFMHNQTLKPSTAPIPELVQTERLSVREEGAGSSCLLDADIPRLKAVFGDARRLLLADLEFPAIVPATRILQLVAQKKEFEDRLILSALDGRYDKDYGWIAR